MSISSAPIGVRDCVFVGFSIKISVVSSADAGARLEEYSGEEETSTASAPRGVRDRVSVCFFGKNFVFYSAGTGAWLEEYSYE
jgi:hypothetical protein